MKTMGCDMRIAEVEYDISLAYENGHVICDFASLDCVAENTLSYKLKKVFYSYNVEYWRRRYVGRKNDGVLGTALKHHTDPYMKFHLYSLFVRRKHYDKHSCKYLHNALKDLKTQMLSNGEENLAILKSAFAKGKSSEDWLDAEKAVENIFNNTFIDIWIYV